MRFLVVDDDELSRELLTLLLEVEGYEVEVAASGEDALRRLEPLQAEGHAVPDMTPDVVLTDMQMTGVAGDALATAMRAAVPEATLLLAMSGSQPQPSALAKFDGFLLKPFEVSQLRELISAARSRELPREDRGGPEVTAADANLSEAAGDLPPLDEDIYEKLVEVMSAPQLAEMYAMCIADARTRIAQMKQLAEAGDDEGYRSQAHALKGGSGLIGAREIYLLASAAERDGLIPALDATGENALAPRTSGVTANLERLSLACERLERILVKRTG